MKKIQGSKIKQTNVIFRLLLISFAGLMVFVILVSWRAQLLETSEYVEFPTTHARKVKTAESASSVKKYNDGITKELK
jgi:hypothetical protein